MEKNIFFPKGDFFHSIIAKILGYKWLLIFFAVFLVAQLIQISFLPWDSIPYIFQGKWFCGEQVYLEFIRPPLPGVVNCILGAEIYSILFSTALACVLYFFAVFRFYKKEKEVLDQFTFALFVFLFPIILLSSNFGSDLFALSFLLLALSVTTPLKKGLFFGLATLSRYNFILFLPVFLWEMRKSFKKIHLFLIPIVLLWLPWLIFNFLYAGDPLFSVNETVYLNVLTKGVWAPLGLNELCFFILLLGVLVFSNLKKNLSKPLNQSAIISIIQFIFSGIKESRFIILTVPAFALSISRISFDNKNAKLFFMGLFALIAAFILLSFIFIYTADINKVFYSGEVPTDSFLFNCKVASDKWVLFYPHGIVAQILPDENRYEEYLSGGTNLVIYNYSSLNLASYEGEVIKRENYVILKSQTCAPQPKKYISGPWSYKVIKWLRDTNSKLVDTADWPE